ncbi:hypothetical protein NP493_422g02005 [Ridgeia piscesae]|uniref:Uncharacterized protein n=1 Tax=Ridgeia piscesae TaxID=27915 RepID=A0AAD9L048_RIDPI|nr:hypothetical protein NP493_422g02005 [Ridgeia piscesae]
MAGPPLPLTRDRIWRSVVPVYDKRKVISILPYSQIPETDELSFEKGEIFVVHNDMGDGWLWVTSQSTALSGIINQELVVEQNGNADPVEANDWFHPDITKKEAGEKLWRAGPESWLVRPSDSNKEDYTLFFYCNCQIQRFKIQKQGRQYYMGGRFFDSIVEIIERYKKEEIVENHTLGKGVLRPRSSALTEDSNGNRNGRDIYATMRQSSGSNFFLNRKDTIIIKGYLNKKSQRTKKWKYMYFVLNGTEQQLYYFDNQKRSKPKGLIDLSYSSLYPVHDSFFGRPNCFQLILRALNQVSVYYICADNSDQAQEWTQALKPYCTNNKPKKVKSMLPSFTELRSLHLKVYDAHKLSCKHAPHPYCIVSLNDVKVCRTQVKETPDPLWDEEFMLDDIPADIESFTISIYNKGKRSKDTEVVNLKVYLSDLQVGETVDEWQNMYPANVSPRVEAAGSLRVRSRYQHEVIMPLKEYTSLKERKRHAVSGTQAYDKPSTTLRDEHMHKRARLQTGSISSGSFLGFSPVPSPEIVQDHNRESMLEEILKLLRKQRVLPNVVNSVNNRPCAPGGSVSTCAVDGTGQAIVPPVGFPNKESEHLPGSPYQWTYAGGPTPGGIPETFLRSKAGDPAGSPEPNPFSPGHRTFRKSRNQTKTRDVTQFS